MSVGERIIKLRKEQNISQVQLASALGITRQAVSKWENDLSVPDMTNLIRLADLLETDSEYLAIGAHSVIKSPPVVTTVVQRVDHVVEKVIEKPVEIEKFVEVERVVEKVIETPRIRKVVRTKYLRNPIEFLIVGLIGMVLGILIGLLF